MTQEPSSNLAVRVTDYLGKSKKYVGRLRLFHGSLVATSLLTSGVTTLWTGVTAARGPLVGSGIPGWQLACYVAAGLGFISTISLGLNQQLHLWTRVTRGQECMGRLRALEVALLNGGQPEAELVKELKGILHAYADALE